MSRYERLCEKYPIVTNKTGYKIYNDAEFEHYAELINDYNKLIHREIINNNTFEIYSLCKWFHYYNQVFPRFSEMMKIAIKQANFRTFMLIFYMWNFYYQERNHSLTYDEALKLIVNVPDSQLKIEFINEVNNKFQCFCVKDFTLAKPANINEDEWDDIFFDEYHQMHGNYHDFCLNKLSELDINFQTNFNINLHKLVNDK